MQANIPDRLNAVLVPEGIARVSYVADSKMTNTGTFTFRREDHTLGNLLRMELLRDSAVKFAGYKHPHPLDTDIVLKVQAASGDNGTPNEVVQKALGRLVNEIDKLRASARTQVRLIREREEMLGGGGMA